MVEGQPVAIEVLLAESAWVRALAESLVRDAAAADDIVQQTWLAALKRPPRDDRPLRPWLRTVVENFARMRGRAEGARAERERSTAEERRSERNDSLGSAEALYERVETQQMLAKEVLALEEPFRSTIVLRYYEGLSSVEIARRIGAPEGTVRWRLKRGLELLRERLDQRHGGERRSWHLLLVPLIPSHGAKTASTGSLPVLAGALTLGLIVAIAAYRLTRPGDGQSATAVLVLPPATESLELETERAPASAASAATGAAGGRPPEKVRAVHARIVDALGAPLPLASLESRDFAAIPGASADGGGTALLAIPKSYAANDRLTSFVARADGFVPATVEAVVPPEGDLHLGELVLARAGAVEGAVVDAQGRALAGAVVRAEVIGSRWQGVTVPPLEEARHLGSLLPADAPSARAGSDGRFRIAELPESYVRLWASAEGFETTWTAEQALLAGTTQHVEPIALLEFDPRHCIEGVVLAPDGAPVASAAVECVRGSLQAQFFRGGTAVLRASADERGHFRICVDPHSRCDLSAVDPERRFRPTVVTPVEPGARDVVVRLADWRPLEVLARDHSGRWFEDFELAFLDVRTGRPLESEAAEWRAGQHRAPYTAFSLEVRARGFATARAGPFEAASSPERIELALEPAASVHGAVLVDGVPTAGARVELIAACDAGRSFWSEVSSVRAETPEPFTLLVARPLRKTETTTDESGRYTLSLEERGRWWLRVEAAGFAPSSSVLELAPESMLEHDLELNRGGALEGRVVQLDGRPVAGSIIGVSDGRGRVATRRVGPDGLFRFEALPSGGLQVRLVSGERVGWGELDFAAGAGTRQAPRWEVVIAAGATARFDLVVSERTIPRIAGRLSFDGVSAGAWTVEAGLASRGKARAQLDPRGRFELELPLPGTSSLRAYSASRVGPRYELEDRVTMSAGTLAYERDWRAAQLQLQVVDPEPESEARVVWSDGALATLTVTQALDAQGMATFERVPAGRLRISVGAREPLEVELGPGERRELVVGH